MNIQKGWKVVMVLPPKEDQYASVTSYAPDSSVIYAPDVWTEPNSKPGRKNGPLCIFTTKVDAISFCDSRLPMTSTKLVVFLCEYEANEKATGVWSGAIDLFSKERFCDAKYLPFRTGLAAKVRLIGEPIHPIHTHTV